MKDDSSMEERIPPNPVPKFEAPPTVPAPSMQVDLDELAAIVASKIEVVVLRRIDEISKRLELRLASLDAGVGALIRMNDEIGGKADFAAKAAARCSNEVMELTQEFRLERESANRRYDGLGARVVMLEEYKLRQTGEDNGSITAAALKERPPRE